MNMNESSPEMKNTNLFDSKFKPQDSAFRASQSISYYNTRGKSYMNKSLNQTLLMNNSQLQQPDFIVDPKRYTYKTQSRIDYNSHYGEMLIDKISTNYSMIESGFQKHTRHRSFQVRNELEQLKNNMSKTQKIEFTLQKHYLNQNNYYSKKVEECKQYDKQVKSVSDHFKEIEQQKANQNQTESLALNDKMRSFITLQEQKIQKLGYKTLPFQKTTEELRWIQKQQQEREIIMKCGEDNVKTEVRILQGEQRALKRLENQKTRASVINQQVEEVNQKFKSLNESDLNLKVNKIAKKIQGFEKWRESQSNSSVQVKEDKSKKFNERVLTVNVNREKEKTKFQESLSPCQERLSMTPNKSRQEKAHNLSVDFRVQKVLDRDHELWLKRDQQYKKLLDLHNNYTENNEILKESNKKLNDYRNHARFLQKVYF